jgi:colicin import membrane protein
MLFRSSIIRKTLFLSVAGIVLAQVAQAQSMAVVERYPSGSIRSEERADQALKDIEAERHVVDARFAENERACYGRFFATDCLQKAKDQRRDALTRMRPIEIEANTFKRRARVEAREKEAAERAAKREAHVNERVQAASNPQTSGDSGAE